MPNGIDTADAIVVGAGLAGLVATAELSDAGRSMIVVDQEPEPSLGGQAFWSLGGLMLVDSPEQRRLRIRDSRELAWQAGRDLRQVLMGRLGSGAPGPVEAFKRHGADFVVERDLQALVRGMNAITAEPLIDHDALEREIVARDREVENPYTKDLQLTAIHGARRFLADRITRVAAPHRTLDPDAGPLIAVRLSILTRKSLGGSRPTSPAAC